ncbi:hypothetical protein BJX61DRAFT_537539 [Aspergillus egyptiacus]|nr:hypothetical protein BJX61DRAFT_537539 [Aspergillus egyptiacus]
MGATTRSWLGLAGTLALLGAPRVAALVSPADVRATLSSQLSENSEVYFPDEAEFVEATERWSRFEPPRFTIVVEVAEEQDVAKAVKYANSEGIPFLAVNGGHGAMATFSRMDHGMEIWMHNLNAFEISEDGETATFGGGIKSLDVIQILWGEGKQTVTGVCECTSYLGPGLGGGHGALQGNYGLISDQFVSMRVVTADGEIHEVSEDSEPDLWWAMQGAGHNFGIVTSITSKIYDIQDEGTWAHEQLFFRGDVAEDLFTRFNELADYQPPGFLIWTYWLNIPEMDEENPIMMASFIQEGVPAVEDDIMDPFRELSVHAVTETGHYTDIPRWLGTEANGKGCERGAIKLRFPVSVPRYNVQAQREFWDAFAEGVAGSSLFNSSMVMLEQYSVHGVRAIPEESTAYSQRQDDLLISPVVTYYEGDDETEALAKEFGEKLRSILVEGSGEDELRAYVNYALGTEDPKSWYGYEPWRFEKLQEPPEVAVTPCEGLPVRYYFEGGLRRVHPYHYTYNTYCKERWRNRTLLDIFTSEFRDREPDYYKKALEGGHVCVNGQPARPDTVLKNGEVVSHTLHRHEPPVTGNDIGIIHETDDLLVIDKPAGVPVHSTGRYHYNSVIEILREKYGQQFIPRPCNRLDRLTSGVMFVGKTAKGADMMTLKLKARTIQKEYVARVKGKFPDGVTVVDQPIMSVSPKVGLNRVRATGKEAKTKFRRLAYYPPSAPKKPAEPHAETQEGVNARPATPPTSYLNESEGYSIVHCLPLTGRTHQIRVHLQFLGHPISNDPIYSNRRVFGPDLGKNDDSAAHDTEIIDRLMQMGRTELPDTVSYRTHFTTPPLLPPGTDTSVVEAIMSKEHEAAVEAYQKNKGERLSGQTCDVCGTELYTDPGVHELGIFLHAVAYSDSLGEWLYRSKMPSWALPPAGLDGPREMPAWEDVDESEEVVIGHGTVPEIGADDDGDERVTALVEGVGMVDISAARQAKEKQQGEKAAAGVEA